jgi:hypothetical protein
VNRIKYLNPRTGEKKTVTVTQSRWDKLFYPRKLWGAQADAAMLKRGFVRCGIRHGKPEHVKAARA